MKKGWISIIIAVALLGLILYMNQSGAGNGERDAKPAVGFMAPEFALKNEQGNVISLSQYKGDKPVFINFWASWCPPCKEEMPAIQEAYEEVGDQVVFLGVNLTHQDTKQDAIGFMKAGKYEMPILFDELEKGETVQDSIAFLYRANSIPTSYFVDKDGVIQAKHTGAMNAQQLKSYLQKVMEK